MVSHSTGRLTTDGDRHVMRMRMATFLTALAAMIAAGTPFYVALPDLGLRLLRVTISALPDNYGDCWFVAWIPLGFLVNTVIPVSKLIAAYGLLRCHAWAWWAAIVAMGVELLFRLIEATHLSVLSYRYGEFQAPEGYQMVQAFSMWPSYVIGLLSALAILFLLRPGVKRSFE